MTDKRPLLDSDRLRERRLAAGLSQRHLADALGVRSTLIMRLERGESHGSLPLRRLYELAEAVGTVPHAVLADPQDATTTEPDGLPNPDSDTLCALLVELDHMVGRDELAEALGWPLRRVHDAARVLRARLRGTGMYLVSTRGLRLRGNPNLISAGALGKLELAHAARRGLDLSTAGILREVVAGAVDADWVRSATNPERVALASLLRMGVIEKSAAGFAVTDDVAYSLGTRRAN